MPIPSNCEVYIRERTGWRLVDIWFYTRKPYNEVTIFYLDDTSKDVPYGQEFPEPSLSLDTRTLGNLIKEARGSYPPSEQMHEHLKDAMDTRDRLLAMIEKKGL